MARLSFLLVILINRALSCDRRYDKECCPYAHQWDSNTNSCTACRSGYFGLHCDIKCPYPSYGYLCQSKCNCNKEKCRPAYGCLNLKNPALEGYKAGYPGPRGKHECRYPNYGANCQNICNCNPDMCNPVFGCQDCRAGYLGPNCQHECRYPNYGYDCQKKCACKKEICNFVIGCTQIINLTASMAHSQIPETATSSSSSKLKTSSLQSSEKISDCRPGYLGPNCSHECRYPNYGYDCQNNCACNEEICNPASGCPKVTDSFLRMNHSRDSTMGTNKAEVSSTIRKTEGITENVKPEIHPSKMPPLQKEADILRICIVVAGTVLFSLIVVHIRLSVRHYLTTCTAANERNSLY